MIKARQIYADNILLTQYLSAFFFLRIPRNFPVLSLFLSSFSLGEKKISSGREKNLIAMRKDSHWEEKKFSL